MDFQQAIKVCFQKYAEFNGRAKRPEFWWFELFLFLASAILSIVSDMLNVLFALATILPSLAVGARRLHDINKIGWFQLLWLIPIIGWLVLLYFFVQEGSTETNQYGESPAD